MENPWQEIQPHAIYESIKANALGDLEKQSLIYLYQPIIGAQALSLYFTLLGDINESTGESDAFLHADLVTMMNISMPQLLAARRRLEGIGLLETYQMVKEDQLSVLYELKDPLTPILFFQENLFHYMLLQAVGEHKYQRLVTKFAPIQKDVSAYTKVTKSFSDVYQLNSTSVEANVERIDENQQRFTTESTKAVLSDTTFDWDFLNKRLTQLGIAIQLSHETRKEILAFHVLYGIAEVEMADVISRVADLTTGHIDSKQLEQLMRQLYGTRTKQSPSVNQEAASPFASKEEEQTYRYNSLKLAGFSGEEIQLVKESEAIAPATYLQAIKNQKNGYVTNLESWTLKQLLEQSGLPASVINILIHYVLVIKGQATFTGNTIDTVANLLGEAGVIKPEEAVTYIREKETQEQARKQETRSKKRPAARTAGKRVRREKLPSWMNQASENQVVDPVKEAEIEKKMQELLNRNEGDK